MPTYQYACTDCADRLEVVQKFTDDSLTVCAACGGKLRKVFSPVGIVFKGSGFYRTDSRASQKSGEPAGVSSNGSNGAGGSAGSAGSAGSDGKKDAAASSSSSSDKSGTGNRPGDKVGSSSGSSGSGSSPGSGSGSGSKVA